MQFYQGSIEELKEIFKDNPSVSSANPGKQFLSIINQKTNPHAQQNTKTKTLPMEIRDHCATTTGFYVIFQPKNASPG